MKTISLLGCGWLGEPLARELVRDGYTVRGSTTSEEKVSTLAEAGIDAHLLTLDPELKTASPEQFFDCDALVLNIPPGRRRDDVKEHHPAQIRSLLPWIEKIPQVILIGTTSVYRSENREVSEEDAGKADSDSGLAVYTVEGMLRDALGERLAVLRLGGLLGGERHPARMLARRKEVGKGNSPVNLTVRGDAIAAIRMVLDGKGRGAVYNVVCPEHPTRRDFYTREAKKLGLDPPAFTDDEGPWKIVRSDKIVQELGFQFRFPDPSDAFPEKS